MFFPSAFGFVLLQHCWVLLAPQRRDGLKSSRSWPQGRAAGLFRKADVLSYSSLQLHVQKCPLSLCMYSGSSDDMNWEVLFFHGVCNRFG